MVTMLPLLFMVGFFCYIFALGGISLFGTDSDVLSAQRSRSNFSSFFASRLGYGACVTVFQVSRWPRRAFPLTSIPAAESASPLPAPSQPAASQVMTGENWDALMYETMERCGWPSAIFFMLVVCIGMYGVMNLFIGVLCNSFMSATEGDAADQKHYDSMNATELQHSRDRQAARVHGFARESPRTPDPLPPAQMDSHVT